MSIEVRHFRTLPTHPRYDEKDALIPKESYGSYSIELYFYKREADGSLTEYRPVQTIAMGLLGAGYATEQELWEIVMQATAVQEKQLLSTSRDKENKHRHGPIRPSLENTFLKSHLNPENFRSYPELYEGLLADERARQTHNEALANESSDKYHEVFLPNRVVVTITEDGNILPEDDVNSPHFFNPETGKHEKKAEGFIFDRSQLPQVASKFPIKEIYYQPSASRSSRETSKGKQTTQPLSNPPQDAQDTVKERKKQKKLRKQEQRARARNAQKRATPIS